MIEYESIYTVSNVLFCLEKKVRESFRSSKIVFEYYFWHEKIYIIFDKYTLNIFY